MKKTFFESGIPAYQDLDKVLSSVSSYENKISEINKYYNKEEIASFPEYLFLRKDYIERKLIYQKDTFLLLRPVTLPIICLCAALIAETGTSVQILNMSIKELFLVLGVLIPCISIYEIEGSFLLLMKNIPGSVVLQLAQNMGHMSIGRCLQPYMIGIP